MKTGGVLGNGRTYEYVVALRAVRTSDFMTADWASLPYPLLGEVSSRIINEVRGINLSVYDVSSKKRRSIAAAQAAPAALPGEDARFKQQSEEYLKHNKDYVARAEK